MDQYQDYDRRWYRPRALAYFVACYGAAILSDFLSTGGWAAILVAIYFAILLIVVTFRRLGNAGLWQALVLLMFVNFRWYPLYVITEDITVHLSDIVFLLPALLGLFWPEKLERVEGEHVAEVAKG
ncbi:hypothetical protein [Sphingomicrobium flavum]|uniref:hypothetical protein n=1 Tax=Sphingomicrobium flavum TaxID=1229164 RepID=UPI0021AE0C89|nr:hypothetical protein [Sphingomicrobium flavum]